ERGAQRVPADLILLGELDLAQVLPGPELTVENPPRELLLECLDDRDRLQLSHHAHSATILRRLSHCVTILLHHTRSVMKMTNPKAPEYAAVPHILTSPSVEARSTPYISEGEFDWQGLLTEAETMSCGE